MSCLPFSISRCRHGGYHARGAGPCFDTVEEAEVHRDRELARISEDCDRKADVWCGATDEAGRSLTWREQWAIQGWPDGREVIGDNGEPKLLYSVDRDGVRAHASTAQGAWNMFVRVKKHREARASSQEDGNA